jgi:hypothetical protein
VQSLVGNSTAHLVIQILLFCILWEIPNRTRTLRISV